MKTKKLSILFIILISVTFIFAGCIPNDLPNNDIDITFENGSLVYEVVTQKTIGACVTIKAGGSSGSGFIISSDGYIITNKHVVETTSNINVGVLSDDKKSTKTYRAKRLEYLNSKIDIAVLKIEVNNLPYLKFANSDEVVFGESGIMIGYPKGISLSVATLLVSNPSVNVMFNGISKPHLMLDAPVNPGNSGGPAINLYGCVMGMITYRECDKTYDNENVVFGLGYAQKSNDIVSYLNGYKSIPSLANLTTINKPV